MYLKTDPRFKIVAIADAYDAIVRGRVYRPARSIGEAVDVTGTTIGKGFAGTMKRHNFAGGGASHGHSVSHRVPGSIGQRQTPGRVFQGKRMSGHLGNETATMVGLEVVRVDAGKNYLLVKGAVPGAAGGDVIVRPTSKAKK